MLSKISDNKDDWEQSCSFITGSGTSEQNKMKLWMIANLFIAT